MSSSTFFALDLVLSDLFLLSKLAVALGKYKFSLNEKIKAWLIKPSDNLRIIQIHFISCKVYFYFFSQYL